jgi:hypothetical protein
MAPSDFYPFGATKGTFAGLDFGKADKFVTEATDVANFISYATLTGVFCEWKSWLQKCINMEGD